jgi:hypothetical protein
MSDNTILIDRIHALDKLIEGQLDLITDIKKDLERVQDLSQEHRLLGELTREIEDLRELRQARFVSNASLNELERDGQSVPADVKRIAAVVRDDSLEALSFVSG